MPRQPRFYADSADVDAVGPLLADGLVHGVTTNPTILARGGRTIAEIPELYARWADAGAEEIFFQSWGADVAELVGNARRILRLGDKAVVKVPATRAGFAAAATLVTGGGSVLLTAVYSLPQAVAAASLGVRYIAPYLGRLRDAGRDGTAEIRSMQALVAGSHTDVLAASIRTPTDIVDLASAGVPYFTAAPNVLLAALQCEMSDAAAADFEDVVKRSL